MVDGAPPRCNHQMELNFYCSKKYKATHFTGNRVSNFIIGYKNFYSPVQELNPLEICSHINFRDPTSTTKKIIINEDPSTADELSMIAKALLLSTLCFTSQLYYLDAANETK